MMSFVGGSDCARSLPLAAMTESAWSTTFFGVLKSACLEALI